MASFKERVVSGLNQVVSRWQALSFNQKVMLGTLIMAMGLASTFLFNQAQDDYDVLYANMSLPDAAATVAKLKDMNAPYRLADGGTTILVPRGRKNELVLDTANELTGDNVVSLSKIPPVLQGDVQKEWIRKLNTDSIGAVLRTMRGIKNAQVLVAQPEESVFTDNEEPVRASVMLMVEPGFRLQPEQVKTVKNLVSHAVPGLSPDNVAIADSNGNALEGPNSMLGGGLTEANMRQQKFEETTRKKLMEILTPLVGRDNAVVSVTAKLNFDQTKSQIHRVTPEGGSKENPTGVVVSQQVHSEELKGGGPKPEGGVSGSASNAFPTIKSDAEQKDDKGYKMERRTTNYAHTEEQRSVVYAPGAVERMTVAVVLNKVLTQQEQQEIRDTVINAAGLDLARGDSVDVKGFQFSESPKSKENELMAALQASEQNAFWLQLASVGAMVLLGLGGLAVFYNLMRKPLDGELVGDGDMADDDAFSYMPEGADAPDALESRSDVPLIEANLDPEVEFMKESLNKFVMHDPTEAARVLMSFMKEN
ncbi:MAG: flagellar basal-body MS-ring/collar protein FliF [Candidatus Melainabacteria bacterium]|nr:flagellar basal-body MS-ring/collar protein FliF [Candidatus Melainabacteria bacterium]